MDTEHQHRRRSPGIRPWVVIGSFGAIALLAAACSSSASPSTSTGLKQRTASARTATPVVSAASAGTLGTILVDQSGFTLYRFAPDGTGKTTCTGSCASAWPPLTVPTPHVVAGAGVAAAALATITRPDGSLQVTFEGMPLYRFSGDKKAGDTMGQGVAGVWFAVPAAAAAPSVSTTTTSPPPSTSAPPSPPVTAHSITPGSGGTMPPAPSPTPSPAATAPPVTAPPATSPPVTAPPPTSPPGPPPGGGGYGY